MNERIEELAKQSKLLVKNGGPRYHGQEQDIENFVALIVEESIKVLIEHDYHGEWLGEKIKTHFGIPFESNYNESP